MSTPTRFRYGDTPEQFGDLYVPGAESAPLPVVVLVHGGFWRNRYDLTLMEPVATDLAARGYAAWNVEYRRLGDAGGGWPGTFDDVMAAIDHLARVDAIALDLDRVGVVGHSAGGHLALLAGRRAGPLRPRLCVGLGPVVDLAAAARAGLSDGAVVEFIGGTPDEIPERYRAATPAPTAATLSVVGSADTDVPPAFSRHPTRNLRTLVADGADHFDLINPHHEAWRLVCDELDVALASAG